MTEEMMQAVALNKIIFSLYKTEWICQLGKALTLMFCKELTDFGLSVISSVSKSWPKFLPKEGNPHLPK